MLQNASEGILVPKDIFFLKILNFVQSFVDCKVSLADGNHGNRRPDKNAPQRTKKKKKRNRAHKIIFQGKLRLDRNDLEAKNLCVLETKGGRRIRGTLVARASIAA
jgi:hypothetical protein